jgi:hypothetical protein
VTTARAFITRRAAVAVAVAVVATTAGAALASTTRTADRKGDYHPPGPGESVYDLRSAKAVAGAQNVRFTIKAWNAAFGHKPKLVGIDIRAGGAHYVAGWNGSTYAVHKGPTGEDAGPLTVRRKSSRKLILSFGSAALGGAHSFRWRIIAGKGCESCPASDRIPNKGFVRQRIG